MIKITGIILSALILSILLKKKNSEFSFLIVLAAVVIIFSMTANDLVSVISRILELTDKVGIVKPYVSLMLKILGVTLLSQFVSDLCLDIGENALAFQTQTASKIFILILSLPIFEALIKIVTGLLK